MDDMNARPQPLTPEESSTLITVLIFMIVLAIVVYIVRSIALGRIFKKAGQPAWKAWIPVYWLWVLMQLGGQEGYWSVLSVLPVVNVVSLVVLYVAMYHVGLKLQKPGAFVLVGIFLPVIWYVWLGFDDSHWKENASIARLDSLPDPHK